MRTRETRKRYLQVELLEGRFALSGGGVVLPPHAMPHGYSLRDMARETALFLTSSNNPQYYPHTPFQVLYFDPSTLQATMPDGGTAVTGGNSFHVSPGTSFYVNLLNSDDSPPIVGNFPTDASGAADYFFDPKQLGVTNTEIIVDGKSTPVGAAYVAGPVETPPLLDVPPGVTGGTHMIELAVFLTPMSAGTHKVEIKGEFAGDAFRYTYHAVYGNFLSEDFTYRVQVG